MPAKTINILPHAVEEISDMTSQTARRVADWLSHDRLKAIRLFPDNNTFDFVMNSDFWPMPDYVHHFLKLWAKRRGYEYVFDKFSL